MVSEWELQSGSPFGSLATYEIPRALHFALYRGNRIAPVPAFCHTRSAMKGNPKVIAELNKALREELTAINQYFLHAEMCENWGYHKLSEFIKKQSIGEMKHAEVLIERILFLDGSPSMQPLELTVGGTVKAMIESDLALEIGAVKQYNDAVAIATKEGDNGSRDLLVQLLKDEESHVDFLEAQMHLIKELGYERYLTQQMGEDEEE
jgi:bacterioferritin